ncbi:MAB_1171c family putative transporter [Streptomyces sp. NPDC058257]|uniref:MAB_1171c family putative transporter n=1 Tax=Streptomyces sp. NPDC058257 TaxID=3346409 RepID=UPI0036E85090
MLSATADPGALGVGAQTLGTVCMWAAVLLRLPHTLGSRQQRELWLAGLAAAAANTLDLDSVGALIDRSFGSLHSVDLVRNICGLISAFALLELVHSLTTSSRRRALLVWLRVAACCVVAGLLAMEVLYGPHGRHLVQGGPAPSPPAPYWLLIIATHLAVNALALLVFLNLGRHCADRSLKAGLLLLAFGTAMAGVFWLNALAHLLGHTLAAAVQPFALALHVLLIAAALTVPTTYAARRTLSDVRDWWRIWPLWRDLVEACPQVLLAPRRSRLREVLWPVGPPRLLLYRQLVEIRDAILVLAPYATPELHACAWEFADTLDGSARAPGGRGRGRRAPDMAVARPAAVLAVVLKGARAARLSGAEPRHGTLPTAQIGADTLPDETAFLITVARIYRSAANPVHPHSPVSEEAPQ